MKTIQRLTIAEETKSPSQFRGECTPSIPPHP
jgi:hypothetical protein